MVAAVIGAEPREIVFTSGGSEADNQAILSAAELGKKKGKKHIVSTAFEHHAVLHALEKLEREGFEVTYLDVHEDGSEEADKYGCSRGSGRIAGLQDALFCTGGRSDSVRTTRL